MGAEFHYISEFTLTMLYIKISVGAVAAFSAKEDIKFLCLKAFQIKAVPRTVISTLVVKGQGKGKNCLLQTLLSRPKGLFLPLRLGRGRDPGLGRCRISLDERGAFLPAFVSLALPSLWLSLVPHALCHFSPWIWSWQWSCAPNTGEQLERTKPASADKSGSTQTEGEESIDLLWHNQPHNIIFSSIALIEHSQSKETFKIIFETSDFHYFLLSFSWKMFFII